MNKESFFQQEYTLPDPRPGLVWGFYLYPGGRKEFRQTLPENIKSVADAMDILNAGKMAIVKPEMAEMLITWQVAEQVQSEELGL
jgi:hypothetical protein